MRFSRPARSQHLPPLPAVHGADFCSNNILAEKHWRVPLIGGGASAACALYRFTLHSVTIHLPGQSTVTLGSRVIAVVLL